MIRQFLFFLATFFLSYNLYANETKKLENISLLLQWKHQFQFAGYYMAKEKGFYEDEGLDVEIKEFQYGLDVAREVINQKVDYGVGKSSLLINSANGDEVSLLYATFQSSPLVLLALSNNGINSIKDFRNKNIMMTGDVKSDATFMSILFSHQLNQKDINVQEHSFDLKDLVDKKTDLMASYISNEPFRLKEEYGLESVIFDPKEYGFDIYNDILFTSKNEVESKPLRVNKFKNASLKGWVYAFNNIEATVDIIFKKYNTQNKSKKALLFEAKELKKLAYYKTSSLGEMKKEKLEKIYYTYKVMGLVSGEINFDKLQFKEKEVLFTKKEKEFLQKKQDIRLCVNSIMPFMEVDKKGNLKGIVNDLFTEFKKELDLDINIIKTESILKSLDGISNNMCDILPLVSSTNANKNNISFTDSFIQLPYALATRLDISFINSLNQLDNKTILYLDDNTFESKIKRNYPKLNFVPISSIEEAMDKIVNYEAFGLFATLEELNYHFPKEYIHSIKIGGRFDEKLSFSIGVKQDERLLLNIFNKLIHRLDKNEIDKTLNKYLTIKYQNEIDYKLMFQVIGVFLMVFLIMLYFMIKQNKLKKEIVILNKKLKSDIRKEVLKSRKKDKALYRQTRLASLGEMIGNIAHQWRQPLNRINLSASGIKFLLNEENIQNPEVNKRIKSIEKNINYMSNTIDDFRNFFHPSKVVNNFDIQETVLKAFRLLDKRTCSLKINIPKNEGIKITGYKNEFLQVVLVILNNALDNFAKNSVARKQIKVRISKDDISTTLEIEDNSGGINPEIIDKIFDPYFTTKFKEEGSGVGLYMAKMIIEKSMSGKLKVDSNKDKTIFFIELNNKGIDK
jgi:signal transduction histidine kinase/ABC-type nitrate/sulfonate/bicarbonate transport system substrate-binding protein